MRWLQFILSHSFFISLCAVSLVFQTAVLMQFDVPVYLYVFTFFATLCSYNFYWVVSSYMLARKPPLQFFKAHLANMIIFLLAGTGLLFSMIHLPKLLPEIGIALLLTITYAIPLLPLRISKIARKAGFLKPVLLALTWAFVTVYIPYRSGNLDNTRQLLMLFNNRFLFMLMLCIIFDSRDAQVDKMHGLRSLSTDVQPKTLRYIMLLIFTLYIINGIVFRVYFRETGQILVFLLSGLLTITVYFFSLKKQGYFFYYFLVDGLMLFSAMLTGLAELVKG